VPWLEQFDFAEGGALVAAPVQAEFQEDADVGASLGAERFGFVAAVIGVGLDRVQCGTD
jgi:hypothetical protein